MFQASGLLNPLPSFDSAPSHTDSINDRASSHASLISVVTSLERISSDTFAIQPALLSEIFSSAQERLAILTASATLRSRSSLLSSMIFDEASFNSRAAQVSSIAALIMAAFLSRSLRTCLSIAQSLTNRMYWRLCASCPMRQMRSSACIFKAGFHSRSQKIILLALVSVMPTPPALIVQAMPFKFPAWKSSTALCRFAWVVSPMITAHPSRLESASTGAR